MTATNSGRFRNRLDGTMFRVQPGDVVELQFGSLYPQVEVVHGPLLVVGGWTLRKMVEEMGWRITAVNPPPSKYDRADLDMLKGRGEIQ